MCIEHLAQASILSIAMDQFTCTVLLDFKTCFRAWGYWMLLKEMHCKKKKAPACNATDSIDDESYEEMHCKKKARICKATEECMDDESYERHCKKKGGVCNATDSKDDESNDAA